MTRVVLVPGVPALLPSYASLNDPVAELRAVCLDAVRWLGDRPVTVLADPQGRRVAEALLAACGGFETVASATSSTTGGAAGGATSSTTGGAVGGATSSTTGGAVGGATSSTTGGAVGGATSSTTGGASSSTTGGATAEPAYLVVGNGTARRSEKAPGHLDERAAAYDDALRAALTGSAARWPDLGLGKELLASLDAIARLPELLGTVASAQVDYDADPFGVQYWVIRWQV